MDREDRHDNGRQREARGQEHEGGPLVGTHLARLPGARDRGAVAHLFLPWQPKQVQRQHDAGVDGCIGEAGAAPADLFYQQRAKRPADGAGEAAEQRDLGNRAVGAFAVDAAQVGKGRVILAASHADADHDPSGDVDGERGRETHDQKARSQQARAGREDHAAAVAVDQPSDAWRHQSGGK